MTTPSPSTFTAGAAVTVTFLAANRGTFTMPLVVERHTTTFGADTTIFRAEDGSPVRVLHNNIKCITPAGVFHPNHTFSMFS